MYHLLPLILLTAATIPVFLFVGAILRHRLMSHRMISRYPIFERLSFAYMWVSAWATTILLAASCIVAWRHNWGGPWVAVTAFLVAVVLALMWLITQRCVTYQTEHFTFVFHWESGREVSLHVNVRGRVKLAQLMSRRRQRVQLVRHGMQEIRCALELSRQLPAQVSTLTLASPWFGHGRHGTMLGQLGEVLRATFPDVEIKPVSIKKNRLDGMLLMITPMGPEWHRVARGRGIEAAGYTVSRGDGGRPCVSRLHTAASSTAACAPRASNSRQ